MGRKEIVQKPVVKIFDDYSGGELPETTKPVRYDFNGRAYHLYLSDESKSAVDQFIADLTGGADEIVTGSRMKAPPIKAGHTLEDVRAWARENGHAVSDNRRAPNWVIDAFNAAH
ncbi:MAG: histone-like nucleoid-structuring protein Lsr2 [Aeromicrobium sp.]